MIYFVVQFVYMAKFCYIFWFICVMFVEGFWSSWIHKVLTNSSCVEHDLHFTWLWLQHIPNICVQDIICGYICVYICGDICDYILFVMTCCDIRGDIWDYISGFTFASPQRGRVQGQSLWGRSCWCCLAWKYKYNLR